MDCTRLSSSQAVLTAHCHLRVLPQPAVHSRAAAAGQGTWIARASPPAKLFSLRLETSFCCSNLQCIQELQRRAEKRGSTPPKRLVRIEREIRALMERVRREGLWHVQVWHVQMWPVQV